MHGWSPENFKPVKRVGFPVGVFFFRDLYEKVLKILVTSFIMKNNADGMDQSKRSILSYVAAITLLYVNEKPLSVQKPSVEQVHDP